MRTNDETENELEDRTEGLESDEPGNKMGSKRSLTPSKAVSKKPKTPFAVSAAGGRAMPKAKFVNKQPKSKVAKSKVKNRTGKKYKHPSKSAPSVAQKMRSFGGDFPI